MKKLLIISTLVLGTFAGTGAAFAEDVTIGSYSGWQLDAFIGSTDR